MIDHVGKCWMQRVNARWRYAVGACTTTLVPPKRLRRLDRRRRIFTVMAAVVESSTDRPNLSGDPFSSA
jgi:hypothetical protein